MQKVIVVRRVISSDERKKVRELIAHEYFSQGYIPLDNEHLVFSSHYDGSNGIRLAAKDIEENKEIGTIAAVVDSLDLLPIDELYHDELRVLREKGLRIAEVGQFAVVNETSKLNRLHIVRKLFYAILDELHADAIDAIVITVNPKHDVAYGVFGFNTFAAVKPYAKVSGAPAVPKIKFLSPHAMELTMEIFTQKNKMTTC